MHVVVRRISEVVVRGVGDIIYFFNHEKEEDKDEEDERNTIIISTNTMKRKSALTECKHYY